MASKDRPHREQKKKPKAQAPKPVITSLSEAPPPTVEVIKPVRKPRQVREDDEE